MITRFRRMSMTLVMAICMVLTATTAAAAPRTASYQDVVLGVAVTYPADMRVVQDAYLFDAFGFTLTAHPAQGMDGATEAGDWLRISWLHTTTASDRDAVAQQLIDRFPGVPIQRTEIEIAGQRAIILAQAPGLMPTTYIYLTAGDRLFEIVYPRASLDAAGIAILRTLRFQQPQRTLESLRLTKADDTRSDSLAQIQLVSANDRRLISTGTDPRESIVRPMAISGCVDYPTWKYLQTPFTSAANGNGYSQAGPNYYGEGSTHQGCNRSSSQNDYYALDMPLRSGDPVLNPGNGGTVRWAGWASGGWSTLGRTVIIDHGNGYLSLSAHLSGINVSVGQAVNANSVIGWAGRSGNGSDTYWASSHLHQGLYLNANISGGGTYGGQSAQMIKVNYCRSGCANYYWTITNRQQLSW